VLHKKNKKLFSICPAPLPPGQNRFRQFPTPGPEGLDLSRGLPGGGMVTRKIEPCIRFWFVFRHFENRITGRLGFYCACSAVFEPCHWAVLSCSTVSDMLCRVILTFDSGYEILECDHLNESHWAVSCSDVCYAVKMVLTFESVDEILKCYHLNESYWAVSCSDVYNAVQDGSNVWVWGWNPKVWPLKWKPLSSTFLWCCLFCCQDQIPPPQLFQTSNFIGPWYHAALSFSGLGSIVLLFVLLFSQQIRAAYRVPPTSRGF